MVEKVSDYTWSSWQWFVKTSHRIAIENGGYPPGFTDADRWKIFEEAIQDELELTGGKNYIGTEEEWENIERREEGREGRKYRDRRGRESKDSIANEVLEGTSITIEQLRSRSQKEKVTKYRREAMSKMYEEGYGTTEIGKYFNRTPGAVNHAYRRWSSEQ